MTSTISRRQILSRSRDAGLDRFHQKQQQNRFAPYEDYEEMWFSHEHLFKDHIAEVLRKWEQIDDEIWAKMIFMSRNRRIAKAYIRVPAIIIDGSDNGFDGYRVGLNGFEDPFRDSQTDQLMNHIEKGCRIGIDDNGNILIKRYSISNVFVKSYPLDFSRSCVGNSVVKVNGSLEPQKKYILFDMAKFELAMMEELKSAYPDRSKLEQQCIVVIGLVRDDPNSILEMPIYIMLINIVALDMLKSKLNPVIYQSVSHRSNQMRVPEFVSIFQQTESNCCENEEQQDPIYGQIGDMDPYKDYFSPPWTNDDYELEDRNKQQRRYYNYLQENGPHSMPTLASIQYHGQFGFNDQNVCKSETVTSQIKPPKLPPRDKKKLSKQINTIKSTRKSQSITSRLVEIPPPDYHTDHHYDRSKESSTKILGSKSLNAWKDKTRENSGNIGSATTNATATTDSIYGTINNNNGHQQFERRYMSSSKGPVKLHNNWPLWSTSNGRYQRFSKSMPSALSSTIQLRTTYGNANTMTSGSPLLGPSAFSSTNINQTLRGDSSLIHLGEDPYYFGLEARVTSNKLHNAPSEHDVPPKMKGLNWMMHKVLPSNYINMLTSKRQKKKTPKSKSSNESSTDSDPYVSINDVYEPIYGYGTSSERISYGWPIIKTRLKP